MWKHDEFSPDWLRLTSGNDGSNSHCLYYVQNPNLPGRVPFLTARIFTSPASYFFPVSSTDRGHRHWLQLYFYPFCIRWLWPPTWKCSNKVLVRSPSLPTLAFLTRLTPAIIETHFFSESSPSMWHPCVGHVFAMVNGINMPRPDGMFSNTVKNIDFQLNTPSLPISSTVMETMHRVNVGGLGKGEPMAYD